jgi:hypothetical protein
VLTSGYTGVALAEHGLDKTVTLLEKPYRTKDLVERFGSPGRSATG